MENNDRLLYAIEADLGLNVPFVKGQVITVNNCWHFSTEGTNVDCMFFDEQDFLEGMNRVAALKHLFDVRILAFSLMDTHVHFILYGDFDQCNAFMHEYVRKTSWSISRRHKDRHKLQSVPINHQVIDTDSYLKTAICYVIKNAPVGGIPFSAYDYPWSSGPLYFRAAGYWSSPKWIEEKGSDGEMVFPGRYVDYRLVERIFKTHRSFNYFMCVSKEKDVEERGGIISHLSLPLQELRQRKGEVCQELFGEGSIRHLNTSQRLQLARTLKARYNSSPKQISRVCGLIYDEVKELL